MREYIIRNPHGETHSLTPTSNGEWLHIMVNGIGAPPAIISADAAESILAYCRNDHRYTVTVQE